MKMSPKENRGEVIVNLFKGVSIITVLVYILGFTITNIYLSQFGILSSEILKSSYLARGFSFGIYLSALVYPLWLLVKKLKRFEYQITKQSVEVMLNIYMAFIALVIFASVVFSLIYGSTAKDLTEMIMKSFNGGIYALLPITFVLGAFILILYLYLKFTFLQRILGVDRQKEDVIKNKKMLFAGVSILIIFIFYYAIQVYPKLPRQFGGGNMEIVSVSVIDEELNKKLSDQYSFTYLLERSDFSLILFYLNTVTEARQTIEINNSQIKSITYPLFIEPVRLYPSFAQIAQKVFNECFAPF